MFFGKRKALRRENRSEELAKFGIDVESVPEGLRRLGRFFIWGNAALVLAASAAIGYYIAPYRPEAAKHVFVIAIFSAVSATAAIHEKLKFLYETRKLDYLIDVLVVKLTEERSKAQAAACVRHIGNRKRKADANLFYSAGRWDSTAEAGRAIAERFHVEPKVAERWIRVWRKDEDSPPHDDSSSVAR